MTALLADTPPLSWDLYANLSVMMFLQYAIWGAWFVVLGLYLERGLKFTASWIGWTYSTMALGTMVTPVIAGAIADKYLPAEQMMAALHLGGAVLLVVMSQVRSPRVFFTVALIYALFYSPTLGLSNSITFSHADATRDFPSIRVWGTIGWIVVNLVGLGWIMRKVNPNVIETNRPLLLAAVCSAALGVYSFFLPHTPPAGGGESFFPAAEAFGLLKEPSFAVFFGVSFVITIVLAFYYGFTGNYFKDDILPKLPPALDWPALSTIGQFSEMIILPFLGWFITELGMKWVLAIGMAAWGVRYLVFALGARALVSPWVVVAFLTLHGVCFDFFFAAGFIHVDNTAPREIKASAQGLFVFLTYGLGMFLGNVLSGYVVDMNTTVRGGMPVRNWGRIWLIPSLGVLAALAIFVAAF
jgi:nucleoside transporter